MLRVCVHLKIPCKLRGVAVRFGNNLSMIDLCACVFVLNWFLLLAAFRANVVINASARKAHAYSRNRMCAFCSPHIHIAHRTLACSVHVVRRRLPNIVISLSISIYRACMYTIVYLYPYARADNARRGARSSCVCIKNYYKYTHPHQTPNTYAHILYSLCCLTVVVVRALLRDNVRRGQNAQILLSIHLYV